MSVFGDGRYYMNDLYDAIEVFIEEGETLSELFEVLNWTIQNNGGDKKLKEE